MEQNIKDLLESSFEHLKEVELMISETSGIYEVILEQNPNLVSFVYHNDISKKIKKFLRSSDILMSRLQKFSLRSNKHMSNNVSSSEEEDSFSLQKCSIMATVIELPQEEDPVDVASSFDYLNDLIDD
jgi:hypothetical protein